MIIMTNQKAVFIILTNQRSVFTGWEAERTHGPLSPPTNGITLIGQMIAAVIFEVEVLNCPEEGSIVVLQTARRWHKAGLLSVFILSDSDHPGPGGNNNQSEESIGNIDQSEGSTLTWCQHWSGQALGCRWSCYRWSWSPPTCADLGQWWYHGDHGNTIESTMNDIMVSLWPCYHGKVLVTCVVSAYNRRSRTARCGHSHRIIDTISNQRSLTMLLIHQFNKKQEYHPRWSRPQRCWSHRM